MSDTYLPGTSGDAPSPSRRGFLGFCAWLTPAPTLNGYGMGELARAFQARLAERQLRHSGSIVQMLVWSEDRDLTLRDQVALLLWLATRHGVLTVAVSPLMTHAGMPCERGRLPALQAQVGEPDLLAIEQLFEARRIPAQQVVELLGGFRPLTSIH